MYRIPNPIFIVTIIAFITIIVAYFVLNSSNDNTFKEAHQDAKIRIQHIQREIEHSKQILVQTKVQLDSVEEKVTALKAEQHTNAIAVAKDKQRTENKLTIEEGKLRQLQNEYYAIQNDKRQLEYQLDSLANNLQQNF